MGQVQRIGKTDRNAAQNFNFRGIDATMSAVGPALREHRVFVIPKAKQITTDTYSTRGGAVMRNATVLVEWMVVGPAGDTFTGCTYGEAADAGDKAVSKAHSVAYRTFLLQALCIPTDEPDPDASSHERSATPQRQAEPPEPPREQSPADKARTALLALLSKQGVPPVQAVMKYREMFDGELKDSDDPEKIAAVADTYREVAA